MLMFSDKAINARGCLLLTPFRHELFTTDLIVLAFAR